MGSCKIISALILIVILELSFTAQGCPPNWIQNGTSCYTFVQNKANWFHAAHLCRNMGSKLVAIDTADENMFLREKIHELHRNDDPQTIGYWTGANDLEVENEWVWNYPEDRLVTYKDWFPGEPNNAWKGSTVENCMVLWGHDNHDYHWNDQPCDIADFFICEADNDGDSFIG